MNDFSHFPILSKLIYTLNSKSEEVKQKHLDILNGYSDELRNNFFFVKVFLSTFIPYPTKDIISKNDIKSDTWEQMYQQLDYEALKSKIS